MVGRPSLVPSKGQLIIESVVGGLRGILEPIGKSFFPSFCQVAFSLLLELVWFGYLGLVLLVMAKTLMGTLLSNPLLDPAMPILI